jgi:hypothetical protein
LHAELLRIVGASNSTHIFGTYVPVEEPSTASIADFRLIAGRRFPALSPPFCSRLKNLAL